MSKPLTIKEIRVPAFGTHHYEVVFQATGTDNTLTVTCWDRENQQPGTDKDPVIETSGTVTWKQSEIIEAGNLARKILQSVFEIKKAYEEEE